MPKRSRPTATVPRRPAPVAPEPGWRRARTRPSLPESHRSVRVPRGGRFWRKMLAFSGPGFLVAVGYMDPGNWATNIAGGSRFAYSLLWVILASNLMAILLQALAARLGIVTGRDLAQACRDHYGPVVNFGLWVLCEIAIAACDLAEVIGSAIALQLLFGIPLVVGVCLTAADVLVVLYLQHRGFRLFEALVLGLIGVIAVAFAIELLLAHPDAGPMLRGFVPTGQIVADRDMLYLAIGILGATVMPHNLYLHSSVVQTRRFERTEAGKREAIRFASLDSTLALGFAFFINAAMLILAASTFYRSGNTQVAEIQDAFRLLAPVLGTTAASLLFAVALLASGQNSTFTGTLAGQIVMEGFLDIRLPPWMRRLITRGLAIVPAVVVTVVAGESGTARLLILSQVILSLQLSFAVFPLVGFVGDAGKMGPFAIRGWLKGTSWGVAGLIALLNGWLLVQTFGSWGG